MQSGGWGEIDEMIVTRKILPAVHAIRDLSGCSLSQALELLSDRYDFLRGRRSQDFTTGPDEYWQGLAYCLLVVGLGAAFRLAGHPARHRSGLPHRRITSRSAFVP
jgi:hypothetical protein